ncbi:MAG: hypothetical protein KF802_02770 [Bdellovibrionaceae bacterium]|nr:hypothetical protein [Pseudobdellovibrionaceae bacterium]
MKKKVNKTKTKTRTYSRNGPVDFQIADLAPLIKASGKSLYRIQKETGLPSGFLFHLKSKKKNRLNPSWATITRIKRALGLSWDQLIEPIPVKKPKKRKTSKKRK